jgi:hypothetical protein
MTFWKSLHEIFLEEKKLLYEIYMYCLNVSKYHNFSSKYIRFLLPSTNANSAECSCLITFHETLLYLLFMSFLKFYDIDYAQSILVWETLAARKWFILFCVDLSCSREVMCSDKCINLKAFGIIHNTCLSSQLNEVCILMLMNCDLL